jgi:hypothetical protein
MPATLPYELYVLILDYLSDEGLKWRCHFLALALICRAWTAPAQRQLFRAFSIRSATLSPLLRVAFLARNRRLASYVLEIRLYALHHSLDTTPAPLLAAVFPNVQRLTFCYALSGTDGAHKAMLSAFPAVKNLNIHPRGQVPVLSGFSLPSRVGLTTLKLRCSMQSANLLFYTLQRTSSSSTLHDISLGMSYHEEVFWWSRCVHQLPAFINLLTLHLRLSRGVQTRQMDGFGMLNRMLFSVRREAYDPTC